MIIEIPEEQDFQQSGKFFLNLAWDAVSDLYHGIENSQLEEWDTEGEVADEFWNAAQRPLASAVALAQQGIEFLLKARIAAVSPYLLLYDGPSNWPANCQSKDTPFAEFRTVDAQDLVRMHDTVCEVRLDDVFKNEVDRMRRMRNTIMHTVDKKLRLSASQVWLWILDASHQLVAPHSWPAVRRAYFDGEPESVIFDPAESAPWRMSWEMMRVLSTLKPGEIRRVLDFAPRQRRYTCFNCYRESDMNLKPTTAQLRPNTPKSTTVYCFVCGETQVVDRVDCRHSDCKGNVLDGEDRMCLTCNGHQDSNLF